MRPSIHSLAAKTLAVQVIGLGLVLAVVGIQQYRSIRDSIHAEAARVGETAVAIFREEFADDPRRLSRESLEGIAARLSGKLVSVSRLRFLDAGGAVLADSMALPSTTQGEGVGRRSRTIRIVSPVHGRYDPLRRSDVIGSISADIDLTLADRRIRRAFLQSMFWLLALVPAFLLLDYLLLGRVTTRRLRAMTAATAALATGDYQARTRVTGRDEIGRLGGAFDRMASELGDAHARLQVEIAEREQAESRIGLLNRDLEASVATAERHNEDIASLNEMSRLLQACGTIDEALAIIPGFFRRLLGDAPGAVYLLPPSRDQLEPAIEYGLPATASRFFAPDQCWAMRLGKMQVSRAGSPVACAHLGELDPAIEYHCAPLVAQSDAIGMLHARFPTAPGHEPIHDEADDARQLMVAAIAENVGIALANLKLRDTLRQQSIRDPLTGLFNRRYLEETLQREIDRALRTDGKLAAIMLDVDHFKRLNDGFGHDAGDYVLKLLGRVLASNTRSSDIACRYGGEEFFLILPNAGAADAAARAEKLRQAVVEMELEFAGRTLDPVTISLGVASLQPPIRLASEILKRADEALYEAKQQGRNRVVVAG